MATRLLIVAHAATGAPAAPRFPAVGDDCAVDGLPAAIRRTVRASERGREIRAEQTADSLGVAAKINDAWNGRDYGEWAGVDLSDVNPAELSHWIENPHLAPPGGEPVSAMARRVARRLERGFGEGIHVAVTSQDVLRAAVLAVTGAPVTAYAAVDVAALDALEVTINGPRVAIRSLRPYPDWL